MSKRAVWDVDGTLCTLAPKGPNGPRYDLAQPIESRIQKLREMFDEGWIIVIKTARGGTTGIDWQHVTERQLEKWGVPYHELYVAKMPPMEYDVWVDDKAIDPGVWE